jgi:hypothetical protein
MRRVRWSSTLRARSTSAASPAEQRQQLALAHGRDRAHDRGIDQARAPGTDHRCQLPMSHRLQRAHLDEKLVLDLARQESIRPGEDLPHALVLGDDGEHHVRRVGDGARVVHDPQAALCLCLAGLGVTVPGHYLAAALGEPLRNRCAHPPETDQTDFHLNHPPATWLEPCHSCRFFASIYPIRASGSRAGDRRSPPSREGRHDQRTAG